MYYPSIHPPTRSPIHPSGYLYTHIINLSTYLSIYLSFYLPTSLPACLAVCLSVSVCLLHFILYYIYINTLYLSLSCTIIYLYVILVHYIDKYLSLSIYYPQFPKTCSPTWPPLPSRWSPGSEDPPKPAEMTPSLKHGVRPLWGSINGGVNQQKAVV